MCKARVIYGISLFCALLFVFFHNKPIAYTTFVALLLLPVLSFLLFLFYRNKLAVMVSKIDPVSPKEGRIVIKVLVKNKSIFPIPLFYLEGVRRLVTYDQSVPVRITGYCGARKKVVLQYEMYPLYRGLVQMDLNRLITYDYLCLFKHTDRFAVSRATVVSPNDLTVQVATDHNVLFGDSDSYSPEVPGDDVSEVFRVRDYQQGDRIKAIHWKISSRSKNIMIRDFSQPIVNNLYLFIDFQRHWADEEKNIGASDAVVEVALSIIGALLQGGVGVTAVWYSSIAQDVMELEINNFLDYEHAISTVSSEKLFSGGMNFASLLHLYADRSVSANRYFCVLSDISPEDELAMQDLYQQGKARIHLFFTQIEEDPDVQRQLSHLEDGGIAISRFAAPPYGEAYDRLVSKLQNEDLAQAKKEAVS